MYIHQTVVIININSQSNHLIILFEERMYGFAVLVGPRYKF